jgi:hypothetical protein
MEVRARIIMLHRSIRAMRGTGGCRGLLCCSHSGGVARAWHPGAGGARNRPAIRYLGIWLHQPVPGAESCRERRMAMPLRWPVSKPTAKRLSRRERLVALNLSNSLWHLAQGIQKDMAELKARLVAIEDAVSKLNVISRSAPYRCRESYPRRSRSPRNCCQRAGDERNAVPACV